MTTREQQARIYNEAVAQGLSEDDALRAAGISDAGNFTFSDNGQLEPARVGPPRRANETIVPPGANIDDGDDDDEPRFTTRPVSSQSTSTSQTTVTGGSVTTRSVTPTTYTDTAQSRALQNEADGLSAQKEARAAELRAQGKTGAEVLRDPQYRALSREAQSKEAEAENAKAVNQAGAVTTTTTPGPTQTEFSQTVDSSYLTQRTAGEDEQVEIQQVNRLSTSGEQPSSLSAADVSDTGGAPTQTLADVVPQAEPAAVTEGLASYGEEDDEFLGAESDGPGITEQQEGISPYGEEDDPLDILPQDQEPGIDPYTAVSGSGDPVDDFTTGEDVVGVDAEGNLTAVSPDEFASAQQQVLLNQARAQAALAAQRRQANDGDWRVKLRLAPGSNYLYRANDGAGREAGILQPLVRTDGVIFPYTPTIQTVYKANYNSYDLTHSNYRGYFYQGSTVEEINLSAVFTAQDTTEAEYLLAVIHFFRSITKMFYGKDTNAGTPPPLVFLQGLGEYQYNLHPCLVSQFNYNLPNDVDYIRARSPNQANLPTSLLQARQRQTVATNPFEAAWQRLQSAGVPRGGINSVPPAPPTLGTNSPTYVPTKIEMQVILLPVQSRSQVSNNFSLQKYANGDLLKGGFW